MQREEKEDEKSYFRRIAFTWRDLHNDEDGMGDRSDPRQEKGMTIQNRFASQTKHEKLQEEKAIVRAVIRYFEKTPPRNASGGEMESSIVNALHRYFEGKK